MFTQKNNDGFTLAELVVVISILAVLSTISFLYFADNISATRDTKRLSDIAWVETALKSYKQTKWSFPFPWEYFNITNNGFVVAHQWKLDKNVRLSTLEKLPEDPKNKTPYIYSITHTKQEFQLAATLENEENPQTFLSGNYKSVSKNILPSITLANESWDLEINESIWNWDDNRKLFLFNKVAYNLPYTFKWSREPYSKDVDFSVLLNEAETYDYWQNSDFTSCKEIYEANKSIGNWQYQYLTWGTLQNINCNMTTQPIPN